MKSHGKVWLLFDIEKQLQTRPLSTTQAQITLLSLKVKNLSQFLIWTPGWENWINVEDFLNSKQNYFVINMPSHPENIGDAKKSKLADYNSGAHSKSDISIDGKVIDINDINTITKSFANLSEFTESNATYVDWDDKAKSSAEKMRDDFYTANFSGDDISLKKVLNMQSPSEQSESTTKSTKKKYSGEDRRSEKRVDFKIEILISSPHKTFKTYSKNISLNGTLLENPVPQEMLKSHVDIIIVNTLEPDPQKAKLYFKCKVRGDIINPKRLEFIETDKEMTKRLSALLKSYETYLKQMKKKTA